MSKRIYQERVGAGAAWLDATRPDWFNEIDLGTLGLESGQRCVLGQIVIGECMIRLDDSYAAERVFANGYGSLIKEYNAGELHDDIQSIDDLAALEMNTKLAGKRGFHLYGYEGEVQWRALTEEWRRHILMRRALERRESGIGI